MWTKLKQVLNEERCREDLRQFVWFGIGYVVVLILGYLLLRQINLSLSVEEMGCYSYLLAVLGILMPILYLNAPQAYMRFNDNHLVSPSLHSKLLPLFLFASVVLAAVAWYVLRSPWALLIATWPFFNGRLALLRSQMRVGAVNLMKIAEIAIPLLSLWGLAQFPTLGVRPTALLVFVLYGLGYGVCFVFPLHLQPCDSPDTKTLYRFLVPVMVTLAVSSLSANLTVVVVKHVLGTEAAAAMGVAARNLIFINALAQLLLMFCPVVYFREMKSARFGIAHSYRLLAVVMVVLFSAAMCIGAPLLYKIVGASAYSNTIPLFIALAAGLTFDFVFDVFGLYFQFEIKAWKQMLIKIVGFIVLLFGFLTLSIWNSQIPVLAFAVVSCVASFVSMVLGIIWAILSERRGNARIVDNSLTCAGAAVKLSIVTVCRNARSTIAETMASVMRQKGVFIEYVVVDGASTDGTIEVIKDFERRFRACEHISFRWVSEIDNGLYDAMNKGIRLSTGEVVGILNADDFLLADDVLCQVAKSFGDDVDCVYGDIVDVSQDECRALRHYSARFWAPWMLHCGMNPPHPAVFIRRSLLLEKGMYDADRTHYQIAADYELMVRYFCRYRIASCYLPVVTTAMRLGGASTLNLGARVLANREIIKANRANGYFCVWPMFAVKFLMKVSWYLFRADIANLNERVAKCHRENIRLVK